KLAALQVMDTTVGRSSRALKQRTACDVALIWEDALSGIRPTRIAHHHRPYLFVANGVAGSTWSTGQAPSTGPASSMGALVALGRSLASYAEAPQAQGPATEKELGAQIQVAARIMGVDLTPAGRSGRHTLPSACAIGS